MIFVPINPNDLHYMPIEARPKVVEDTTGIAALDDNGIPQAICVFDSWSYNSCMIHLWIENPFVLKHGFAEEVFNFVFGDESGRELIIAVMPEDNKKVLKFNKHIGFEEIYRIKDGFKKGVDYIVMNAEKKTVGTYNGWKKPTVCS